MKLIKFNDQFININYIIAIWPDITLMDHSFEICIQIHSSDNTLIKSFKTKIERDEAFKNLLKELHEI